MTFFKCRMCSTSRQAALQSQFEDARLAFDLGVQLNEVSLELFKLRWKA